MTKKRAMAWLLAAAWSAPLWAAEVGRPSAPPPDPVGAGGLLQVFVALVLVLLLIVGMAWLMRRVSGFGQLGGGAIRVLAGVSVGQRERVVLVQVGEQQLLLGVAPGRVQTLHVLAEPIAVGSGAPPGSESFAERLTSALKKGARP